MPRHECDCGGLIPTLDDLLAAARSKSLPRIAKRHPAKIGASLKGWLSWSLINRAGETIKAGDGPNLILNQGLDEIASTQLLAASPTGGSYLPLIRYAAVGTDNTAPAAAQTGLGTEIARTDTTYATETMSRPSPGVYRLSRFIEFDYDEGNGNLTEWGFSSSGSAAANLFNRALFLDDGGDPDPVTKTSSEKLRVAYTLEVTLSPVTMTSGSFAVTNVGTVNGDYMLLGGPAPASVSSREAAPDLVLFSALARGSLGTIIGSPPVFPSPASLKALSVDVSGVTYSQDLAGSNDVTETIATIVTSRDAYSTGSYERGGGGWKFETTEGNLNPIKGFYVMGRGQSTGIGWSHSPGYVFDLDLADEFQKDDEHTLTVGAPTVSWGRTA